jgi:hypothetical protein
MLKPTAIEIGREFTIDEANVRSWRIFLDVSKAFDKVWHDLSD